MMTFVRPKTCRSIGEVAKKSASGCDRGIPPPKTLLKTATTSMELAACTDLTRIRSATRDSSSSCCWRSSGKNPVYESLLIISSNKREERRFRSDCRNDCELNFELFLEEFGLRMFSYKFRHQWDEMTSLTLFGNTRWEGSEAASNSLASCRNC